MGFSGLSVPKPLARRAEDGTQRHADQDDPSLREGKCEDQKMEGINRRVFWYTSRFVRRV